MGRLGFFDLDERYQRLSENGNPLVNEAFRSKLATVLKRSDGSKGARPPYDPVLMFKVVILHTLYILSDDATMFLGSHQPGLDPKEALQVVGEVGEPDLGPSAGQADGLNEQSEAGLLGGELGLDRQVDLRAGAIGLVLRGRQVVAGLTPEVDLQAPTVRGQSRGDLSLNAICRGITLA